MIDVRDRVPKYPGRVTITDNADGTKDISRADEPAEEGTPINRATAQLLQADIRDVTVKSGESITAGTVVDVGGSGAYYNIVTTAPTEDDIHPGSSSSYNIGRLTKTGTNTYLLTQSSLSTINLTARALVASESGVSGGGIATLENSSGTSGGTAATYLPISDTKAVVIYRPSSLGFARYRMLTLTSTGGITADSYASFISVSIVSLDSALLSTTNFLYVYNPSGSDGLKAAVGAIGDASISEGTVYSLADNTGTTDIHVVALSASKALIYYTDTATGYGMVVAVSISGTAVTFGTPVTLSTSTVSSVQLVAESANYAEIVYVVGSTCYARVLYVSGTTITLGTALSLGTGTATAICLVGTMLMATYSDSSYSYLVRLTRSATTLSKASTYTYLSETAQMPQLAAWGSDSFIVCYVNSSSKARAMLCRIHGSTIAGTITDQSKTAIALVGGSGGDTIKVAYSGHVQLDGVTAGTTITTDGIMANSPQDGWLEILSAWVVSTIKSLGGG